jgi:hypothetical protein
MASWLTRDRESVWADRGAHLCELDDLPRAEAQLLVVIQHRVHVLNPDSIYWPVEHVPLLVGVIGDSPRPDERGENPICPAATREDRAIGTREAGWQAQLVPRETWLPNGSYLLF